ncbi:flagellar basal body M-ring protein FliF [Borrelia miyamotoi]|uniref:Flagellar basal-body MS-ring/collar protein FliF n=1 Tax=Borrelia miyamotoi TaxID=47466 RepID=A0AAP9CGA0_9SPIR|nr:flagellar basal-body MS-ring/collar protein FliF [Borrelia miyamotoi]AHH05123.1 Flagellar M-ring protein FliF [Borrelia miyamotoi FR64b]ATQ14912.1 flagellar basal-body MS-ring/collar protein FliF [Borrelia miyamotoi]ATQ16095.1 flagellar basal-body MS-ring/collar protein FliF [Borrelia miyamotoi]ATQ17240.1 flagellar basal-body MS-ring/collar protein FliF [Borrelia miyamotoi]ATQ18254.1 flagellar basal-body MS-ring/collar protein FliF [Borrelia miyamotoi]
MNNFITKFFASVGKGFKKASMVQKMAFGLIVLFVILALIFLVGFSTKKQGIALFGVGIKDQYLLDRIVQRLDKENVEYTVTADGKIYLSNGNMSKRMRAILVREELVPVHMDPWYLFDIDRWTITDFERNINLRRSITRAVEQHIVALDDVDAVSINLVMPEKTLFKESQEAVKASVRITPKPGSDIVTNRKKVEGLVKLIQYAIEGLESDNIAIVDNKGTILNDFSNLGGIDRIDLAEKERKLKLKYESMLRDEIDSALSKVLSGDRFMIARVNVTLDTSRQTTESKEYAPIEIEPQDPRVSYNTRKVSDSTLISSQVHKREYEGQGFSPWGPPGQEGNTPPEYRDLSDIIGKSNELQETKNVALNEKKSLNEKEPARIAGISLGIFIDGVWSFVYDEFGNFVIENGMRKREYKPISDEALKNITDVLQSSFEYKPERGDAITVRNVAFDRANEFRKIDEDYFASEKFKFLIFIVSIIFALLILIFTVFFIVSRELERRRRLREEDFARQAHLRRQQSLMDDSDDIGVDDVVSGLKEEDELQSNVEILAREKPEDVAKLIRTWIVMYKG